MLVLSHQRDSFRRFSSIKLGYGLERLQEIMRGHHREDDLLKNRSAKVVQCRNRVVSLSTQLAGSLGTFSSRYSRCTWGSRTGKLSNYDRVDPERVPSRSSRSAAE